MSAAPRRAKSDPLKDLLHSLNCTIEDMKPFPTFAAVPKGKQIKADLIRLANICASVIADRSTTPNANH